MLGMDEVSQEIISWNEQERNIMQHEQFMKLFITLKDVVIIKILFVDNQIISRTKQFFSFPEWDTLLF